MFDFQASKHLHYDEACRTFAHRHNMAKLTERICEKIHREDVHIFRIRIVEPHHDGTPYWHVLMFMLPEEVEQVRGVVRDYA